MKKTQRTLRVDNNTIENEMHLAFELSLSKWKLVFGHSGKMRTVSRDARNFQQLQQEIEKAKCVLNTAVR